MGLTGDMLIGGAAVQGSGAKMRAVDPSNGSNLTHYSPAAPLDVGGLRIAWSACDVFARPAWK